MKTIPLDELLQQITPLPYRSFLASGSPKKTEPYPDSERTSLFRSCKIADEDHSKGNPMCHGNLIAHVYNHSPGGHCVEDAAYLTHAANVLPELVAASTRLRSISTRIGNLCHAGVAIPDEDWAEHYHATIALEGILIKATQVPIP